MSYEIKRGDSFYFAEATLTEVNVQGDEVPVNLTGVTFKSQVRDAAGALIADAPVAIANALQGKISMAPVATDAWPLKELCWDLQIERAGVIVSSETLTFKVIKDVSR